MAAGVRAETSLLCGRRLGDTHCGAIVRGVAGKKVYAKVLRLITTTMPLSDLPCPGTSHSFDHAG